ncbi:MAG: hypothetical protein M1821_006878 [Bathelium mastoideum]|nr:MAG: hypothetical protein M1821_006878 [Bathelium mastoideum]
MEMKAGTTLGLIRVWWLAFIVNLGGGFLFGYDSGIVGGVLTFTSYEKDFRYASYGHGGSSTRVSSLAVSLQQLGGFVGCFLVWPMTDALGRRKSLMISSVTFCIGAIIQTINTHSLPAFYVARVIAGLGLGSATVVVPMYTSEMAPKEIRGTLGGMFQWMYTWGMNILVDQSPPETSLTLPGIFLSYWVDYGVQRNVAPKAMQWQIPIALQLIPAGLLGLSMFTVTESVRWLTKKGRHEEAWESLKWIRADDSQATVDEMEEIRYGVELEFQATEGFRFQELLQRQNLYPLMMAFAIFTAQQATGATAFAYYSTQYFKKLVGGSGTQALLLSGIFGAVKVVACAAFVFLLADRFGRRIQLTFGAAFMAACQITTAVVVKCRPPPPAAPPGGHTNVTHSGIATVALIYLFVIAYNLSWGPLPWPYVSEIFSARIREPGVATGVAAQWLWNFVFTLTTPYMISNLGWGTFLLWGLFDTAIALFSWTVLKETKGKSLEEIAQVDAYASNKDLVEQETSPNKQ